jgi:cathepsin L
VERSSGAQGGTAGEATGAGRQCGSGSRGARVGAPHWPAKVSKSLKAFICLMVGCLIFTLLVSLRAASESNAEVRAAFSVFKTEYAKAYDDEAADLARFAIFAENYRMINDVNRRNVLYSLAVNRFADMTQREYSNWLSGLSRPLKTRFSKPFKALPAGIALPAEIDWRQKGAVNPIRNQFQCGACWAFSANAAAESAWFIANGTLTRLSEQQLVDCSQKQGNAGCSHGSMDFAFEYMKATGPKNMCDGRNYKYVASTGFCFASECKNTTGVTITGYTEIQAANETALHQVRGSVHEVPSTSL